MEKLKNKIAKIYKYGKFIKSHLKEIDKIFSMQGYEKNNNIVVYKSIDKKKIILDFENDEIIYGDIPGIPKMTSEDYIRYNNLPKIPLVKNKKIPAQNIKYKTTDDKKKHCITNMNFKYNNFAFVTGPYSNILALDIDVDNNGMAYWFKEYVEKYNEPLTRTHRSRKGGKHYLFNFSHADPHIANIIQNQLKTKAGYLGVGIDVRHDNGLLVTPGSSIDGKYYTVEKELPISDMPKSLVDFLLQSYTAECKDSPEKLKKIIDNRNRKVNIYNVNDYIKYGITDDKLNEVLNGLEKLRGIRKYDNSAEKYDFLNSYQDWLLVLTVFKNLDSNNDRKDLFFKWSAKSSKFNHLRNEYFWDFNEGHIDINHLINIINMNSDKKMDYVQRYKKLPSLDALNQKFECEFFEMNKPFFVNLENIYDPEYFNMDLWDEYQTIIARSDCGTGKTTGVAKLFQKMQNDNPDVRILCLTSRCILSDAQINAFSKFVEIVDYRKIKRVHEWDMKNLTMCINSLEKKVGIDIESTEYMNDNLVIYIDEINEFLTFTHNDLLDAKLRDIYSKLRGLIKHCNKLILTDDILNLNVYKFIEKRVEKGKVLCVNNKYNKFKNIPFYRIRDENIFINKIFNCIKNNKPYFFGSDCCSVVTDIFNQIHKMASPEMRQKLILVTAESGFDIPNNVLDGFLGKFVHYSPKICTGLDYNNLETRQDVFLYIKGHLKHFTPAQNFQQLCRCRNIKNAYVYCETEERPAQYKNINDLDEQVNRLITQSKFINEFCSVYDDETDTFKVHNNTFREMFLLNEYIYDCYRTNVWKHFELIVQEHGFKIKTLKEDNNPKVIDENIKKNWNEFTKEKNDIKYNNYIDGIIKGDIDIDTNKTIKSRLKYLGLIQVDENDKLKKINNRIRHFEDISKDAHAVNTHNNIIRCLKNSSAIHYKTFDRYVNNYDEKNINMQYTKINIVKQLEKEINENIFEAVDIKETDFKLEVDINQDMIDLINKNFNMKKKVPTNMASLKLIYIGLLKHICGHDFINSTRKTCRNEFGKKTFIYTINDDCVNYHLSLLIIRDPYITNIRDDIIKKYNINRKVPNDFID
jgi:hypothetical protein